MAQTGVIERFGIFENLDTTATNNTSYHFELLPLLAAPGEEYP
jgi:hypothetical protein